MKHTTRKTSKQQPTPSAAKSTRTQALGAIARKLLDIESLTRPDYLKTET